MTTKVKKNTKPKQPKSAKTKQPKSAKSSKTKQPEENVAQIIADESESDLVDLEDVEFDADEEEFFTEHKFKDFDNHIEFHIFDPEKYTNELHKEITIVPKERRKTSEVITLFEFTDIISNRAEQISKNSPIFTPIGSESDPIKMAEMEIKMKRCPLSIRRMLSNNTAEIWEVNEMIVIWT
jgi:DNA-directed RNA polymerase I, II, and III subunit RPABC2